MDRASGLFGVAPGADFPAVLVDGLIARMRDRPPEAMARVTLFLNTARMLASVRAAFDARGARLLPRLRLLATIGAGPLQGLTPAVPPLRRRLEIARLVAALAARLPDFAPGVAVFDLADSLARLMDEMQGEGVPPEALEAADLAENHAVHWERSLAFIRIVAPYFEAGSEADPEARQRRMVEALIAGWRESAPPDPVILAGSTGSRGTTQLLMRAIAGLPNGAVVLPGFDFDMTDQAWNSLCSGPMPNEDHPQYRFRALADALGVNPATILPWTDRAAPAADRNRVISLALRPAPVTDQWMSEGAQVGQLPPAFSAVTLVEAASPRLEALTLALRLRKAAEDGIRAALVTPDRTLARRVTAALDRWGIVPDDSAGKPLVQSAPGRFLRQTAALAGRRLTSEMLVALLKHPLTATGAGDRGSHLRLTRDLELHLRRFGPPFPEAGALRDWAVGHDPEARGPWTEWIIATLAVIEDGLRPLSACVETHLGMAEALAAGPGGAAEASELWKKEAGIIARAMMDDLRREAGYGGTFGAADYARLLDTLLSAQNERVDVAAHPLISIRGTLEARVGGADLVLLAGLNEGVWPSVPDPDPWLSRQMRMTAGLLLPERQIGLSAHDFQQAAGASEVVLSRAIRDDEAETVPSRWLARLTNLLAGLPDRGGPDALDEMRARGRLWHEMAEAVEMPSPALRAASPPAGRPAPRPPVAARPRRLSVTAISRLIRDPYAIYAEHVLRLRPLDPLTGAPDARLRGEVLHGIVERFVRERPAGESVPEAADRLLSIAEAVLGDQIPWPSAQRIWRARIARIAAPFAVAEEQRAARGTPAVIEEKGSVLLKNGQFTLTARPDRIDLLADGRAHVYDYKSGEPPSKKQQRSYDKQLPLEAGMVERGAFPTLGPREVEGVTYVRLGGDGEVMTTGDEDGLFAKTWADLERLIAAYASHGTGYTSRRAMFGTRSPGDYDHLARFGEWDMGDPSAPEDVG